MALGKSQKFVKKRIVKFKTLYHACFTVILRTGIKQQMIKNNTRSSYSIRRKQLKELSFSSASFFSLCFLLFSCLFLTSCKDEREFTIEKVVLGYKGEAKRYPYLAATRFLQQHHYKVEQSSKLQLNTSEFGTVFLPASVLQSESNLHDIKNFIKEGGHVVCILEYGEKEHNDFWRSSVHSFTTLDLEKLSGFMETFQIKVHDDIDFNYDSFVGVMQREEHHFYEVPESAKMFIELPQGNFQARMGGQYSFSDSSAATNNYAYTGKMDADIKKSALRFISKPYDRGRISFVSDGRIWRNPHLASQNHASILYELVALSPKNDLKVLFSAGFSPSFMSLLMLHFPYFTWGLVLLILVWVLFLIQRFGPMIKVRYAQHLQYLNTIEATGQFLWEQDKADYLIAPLQERAKELMGLQHKFSRSDEGLQVVAKELQLSVMSIQSALSEQRERSANEFIDSVQILQKIIQYHER